MFLKILDRLEEIIIATLMALATALIFVAVVQRYAAATPALYAYVHWIDLSWAQELCIYMFVWMPSSAPPTAFAPASTSVSTCSSTSCPSGCSARACW